MIQTGGRVERLVPEHTEMVEVYRRPTSLAAALAELAGAPAGTRLVAGGTDVMVELGRGTKPATGLIDLTALEFRLLVTLCDRRDRVQPRATLLRDVWQIDGDVPTRTVDTHVRRLREKLGGLAPYLETVRGVGYRIGENEPA